MILVNTQLHGYRQGHQLLDSTISLSKSDQSIVDRLSDVAGPLRPGEFFEPYLSAYPLPSDQYYVLARTWQDLTVPRAGCVRTLSAIIPANKWQDAHDLQSFLDFLNPRSIPSIAVVANLIDSPIVPLPQAPEFRASELLEALFLEDSKPVALFDAPSPELIAARLLTALWPAFRRRFALSTFALSPRKIEGRNFDLVFAPKDARSRFADWPGRRIDARIGTAARHRWTSEIVERVFRSPVPRLLADHEIRMIDDEEGGAPAALRIALLWEELLAKLERSPSAALGLLDIASSNMRSSSAALHNLHPALSDAAHRAVENMPEPEAWEFIGALVCKMFGTPLASAMHTITDAVRVLTGRSPTDAIRFLDQTDRADAIDLVVPAVADGLAKHFGGEAERALAEAQTLTFRRLIFASHELARAALASPDLVERITQTVVELKPPQFDKLRDIIVPALVNDGHVNLARPLFASLDIDGVLNKVRHLNEFDSFHSVKLLKLLIERARDLFAIKELRNTLFSMAPSPGRDEALRMTISPFADDVWWLLEQTRLSKNTTNAILGDVIRRADDRQFEDLFSESSLAQALIGRCSGMQDILLRAAMDDQLSIAVRTRAVYLLPASSGLQQQEILIGLLEDCLRSRFDGDELSTLSMLLGRLGPVLDGSWLIRKGLDSRLSTSTISRNIVACNNLPDEARNRFLAEIDEFAKALTVQLRLEIDEKAARACAKLFWDAQSVDFPAFLRGADELLPTLLRSVNAPVSAIVATTFPLIYRELAKGGDAPSLWKFVRFTDWDRCKMARIHLVDAFLSSETWQPSDLALTACRAMDVERILKRVVKSSHGNRYLSRIAGDVKKLPDFCRDQIEQTMKHI